MSLIVTQGYGRREKIMVPLSVKIDVDGVLDVSVAVDSLDVALAVTSVIEVAVTIE
jgi:hypothetical protein